MTGNLMIDLLGLLFVAFGVLFVVVLGWAVYKEMGPGGPHDQ